MSFILGLLLGLAIAGNINDGRSSGGGYAVNPQSTVPRPPKK